MKPYIPNTLLATRKKLGLRQEDVANKLGFISSDRLSKWERGLSYPHLLNLFKICRLYGVSVEELYPIFHTESEIFTLKNF